MVRLIGKKIQSATLIEVLIALVIIMIVFTITITLFRNVIQTGISLKKIQVRNQLELLCNQVQHEGFINAENIRIDSVDYTFFSDTIYLSNISKVSIKATRNGQLLGNITALYKMKRVNDED